MSSNSTANYGLCQWEENDAVRRIDFNEDNAKIDAALKAAADARAAEASARAAAVAALNAAVARRGNCQIQTSAYTGDGSTTKELSFGAVPKLVIIIGLQAVAFFTENSNVSFYISSNGAAAANLRVTWSGSKISFTGNDYTAAMNRPGYAYEVISFFDMS